MSTGKFLTLQEAADHLGVHYMTVYRYVRTGRIAAELRGSRWVVPAGDLSNLRPSRATPGRRAAGDTAVSRETVDRLVARLTAGDEAGAWDIVQELLARGATPGAVYLGAFCPALVAIGAAWANDEMTVADEHQASVVVQRLIGRLGPLFRTRGPRVGTVVIGAPAGEMHALPTALVADILRAQRFRVLDLGADVPADAFTKCAFEVDALTAVVVSVTQRRHARRARNLIAALRAGGVTAPIVIGGAGVSERDVGALGADHMAATTEDLLSVLTRQVGRA
ncbi:MAG TPA: B12-binding domain-containing protein [Candidatus Dormibacteraeota bacterium]|nr:B12-binding domain-containing protein [Candidatus Dormibacteraeota bacterium]